MDEKISRILEEFCNALQNHLKDAQYSKDTLDALRNEGIELSLMVNLSKGEGEGQQTGVELSPEGDGLEPKGPRKFSPADKNFFEELKIQLPIRPDNQQNKD